MKKLIISIVVLSLVMLFVGCASFPTAHTQNRREMYVTTHPNLSEQFRQDILTGRVRLGMSKEEVIASWGKPPTIYVSVNDAVRSETWLYYYKHYKTQYLYFEDDLLVGQN